MRDAAAMGDRRLAWFTIGVSVALVLGALSAPARAQGVPRTRSDNVPQHHRCASGRLRRHIDDDLRRQRVLPRNSTADTARRSRCEVQPENLDGLDPPCRTRRPAPDCAGWRSFDRTRSAAQCATALLISVSRCQPKTAPTRQPSIRVRRRYWPCSKIRRPVTIRCCSRSKRSIRSATTAPPRGCSARSRMIRLASGSAAS